MFGMWIKPASGETRQQAVTRIEALIGRKLEIDHYYHGWQAPLVGDYGRWSVKGGRTLLIGWKAVLEDSEGLSNRAGAGYVRWADIAAGRHDDVIEARARELKRVGETVYLNFHHEPEDDKDLPGELRGGTPGDFIQAWRHIWDVFQERGATNVRFVWVLTGFSFAKRDADRWFPGNQYVDAIGADTYNWYGTRQPGSGKWRSFAEATRPAYEYSVRMGLPLWVVETGTLEDPAQPGRKAQWYEDAAGQIARWPNLQAFVYFMGGKYGFRIDSSPSALEAFRNLAHEPYFGPG